MREKNEQLYDTMWDRLIQYIGKPENWVQTRFFDSLYSLRYMSQMKIMPLHEISIWFMYP